MEATGGRSVEVAHGDPCRRPSRLEAWGARVGRTLHGTRLHGWLRALFRGVLSLASRGRGFECVLPGGEVVRVAPAFRHVTWNRDEYDAFKAAVRPGASVLDVGANVGAYSLLFA